VAGILLLALVLVAAILRWPAIEAWLRAAGPTGALAFVGVFVVVTVACFPVSVLGFTAGYVYGPVAGYGLLLVALPVAGSVMFALGRSGLRASVQRLTGKDRRLRILERMAARQALRLNLLARLSPFNFGLVCYTLASGRTGWRDYLLGLLGTLPSLAVQVMVGVLARRGVTGGGTDAWRLGVTVLGVGALLLLGWQVSRLARRAWQEAAAGESVDEPDP
jgi:uncharacterized membrane protein YdjX (TVP38/TMEM64 family)